MSRDPHAPNESGERVANSAFGPRPTLPSATTGGVTAHDALTKLAWPLSGHTGTASRLAGFDGSGNATQYEPAGGVEISGSTVRRSALTGDVTAAAGSGSVTVDQARGLRETAGPTTLAMGAVADGQVLRRSGSTVAGYTLPLAVHEYTTAGTSALTIPTDAVTVTIELCVGAGGAGGGGRRGAADSNRFGGGGGGASLNGNNGGTGGAGGDGCVRIVFA